MSPHSGQSNERQFLKDFVTAAPGSAGARLAAWLQPEPRLDPNRCELKPIQEPVRYGWPTQLQIVTRDQYGDTVYIPNLKIEIRATPAGVATVGGKPNTASAATAKAHAFAQNQPLPPKLPYEPTIKDKMSFKAITFMKPYQPYSFEELRFAHPTHTRTAETLSATDLGDYTFGAQWTPSSVGTFCLTCTIDGVAVEEVYRVDVKDAGNPPPPPPAQRDAVDAKRRQPPNKQRRFVAANSAGLRIRAHPTLQSEQVGIVQLDGVIAFVDEQENDDGVWVRLSTESIRQHCSPLVGWYPAEAWCLQYNQHVGRTLLQPVVVVAAVQQQQQQGRQSRAVDGLMDDELRANLCILQEAAAAAAAEMDETITVDVETSSIIIGTAAAEKSPTSLAFQVDSSSGFVAQINAQPQSSNPFIFSPTEQTVDPVADQQSESLEALLEPLDASNPFSVDLFPVDADLADDDDDDNNDDDDNGEDDDNDDDDDDNNAPKDQRMHKRRARPADTPPFDFGGIASLSSSMSRDDADVSAAGQLSSALAGGAASKLQALQKWFKGADGPSGSGAGGSGSGASAGGEFSRKRNELTELASVSVRDLVKTIGGAGNQNGNDGSGPSGSAVAAAGSSAAAVPDPSAGSSPVAAVAGGSKSGELSSDRSIVVSSLGRDHTTPDSSPGSFKDDTLDTIAYTGGFSESVHTQAEVEEATTTMVDAEDDPKYSPRKQSNGRVRRTGVAQSTTSADEDDDQQPKLQMRKKTLVAASCTDKADTVAVAGCAANAPDDGTGAVQRSKRALPSSLAESLRAVFAAFLWHEGLVHDAMACASFLKFHPELPKELNAESAAQSAEQRDRAAGMGAGQLAGANMTREQRAQQRYSVEVANAGNYLNIRPSTLETLTKSGNSSVQNRRARKMTDVS